MSKEKSGATRSLDYHTINLSQLEGVVSSNGGEIVQKHLHDSSAEIEMKEYEMWLDCLAKVEGQ